MSDTEKKEEKEQKIKEGKLIFALKMVTFKGNKKMIIILIAVIAVATVVCAAFVISNKWSRPYGRYNLSKYVKVGKYKGLSINVSPVKVAEKEVNEEIKKKVAKTSVKNFEEKGVVKDGDTVKIDYTGKVNGKEFDGGSGKNVSLTIGSGKFIDGFESKLIGTKVGKRKNLKLKFPKGYTKKSLAGKKAIFTVKIKSKQITKTPKFDKTWVKNYTKYNSVKDFKEATKKDLEKEKKEKEENIQKENLWNMVISSSSVKKDKNGKRKYPEKETEEAKEQTEKLYRSYASQYRLSYKDFLKNQLGMSRKQFNRQLDIYAKSQVKDQMVVFYIAGKENIKVSDKEYESYIKKSLKTYGYTEKNFEKQNDMTYEEYMGKTNIWTSLYKRKVENFILKNAVRK